MRTITLGQGVPGNNGNEWVLQNWSLTIRYYLKLYPERTFLIEVLLLIKVYS